MEFNVEALQAYLSEMRKNGQPLRKDAVFQAGKYSLGGWTHQGRTAYVLSLGRREVGVLDLLHVPGKGPVILAAWFAEDMRGKGYFKEMYREVMKRTTKLITIKTEKFLSMPEYDETEEELFINGSMQTVVIRKLKE